MICRLFRIYLSLFKQSLNNKQFQNTKNTEETVTEVLKICKDNKQKLYTIDKVQGLNMTSHPNMQPDRFLGAKIKLSYWHDTRPLTPVGPGNNPWGLWKPMS